PLIVSTVSSFPIDKIGAAADGPLWFQLYATESEDQNRELIERAVGAGCRAVALTVDVQYTSHRERVLHDRHLAGVSAAVDRPCTRRRAAAPPSPYNINGQAPFMDWRLIDQLLGFTKVPLLLKGILTAEDALLAVERGADGIVVSNHGARY